MTKVFRTLFSFPWILFVIWSVVLLFVGPLMYLANHDGAKGDMPLVFARQLAEKIFPSQTVHEVNTLETNNLDTIEIHTTATDVDIMPAEASSTSSAAELELSGSIPAEKKPQGQASAPQLFTIERNGSQLGIRIQDELKKEKHLINMDPIEHWARDNRLQLAVKLPESFHGQIRILTDNGNVRAKNVAVRGLQIRTRSGAIETKDIQSEVTDIKSTSGAINGVVPQIQ